jgi:hypothetical protein
MPAWRCADADLPQFLSRRRFKSGSHAKPGWRLLAAARKRV